MSRPELPEAEYRIRQWLGQWLGSGDGYAGKVLRRFVLEYDRRGRALGMPSASRVLDPPEDTPPPVEFCHNGRQRLQCGRCRSLIETSPDGELGGPVDLVDALVDDAAAAERGRP